MKRLFKFKYPKIFLLILFIILAYFIFSNNRVAEIISSFGEWSYLGIIIAGTLFSFGFTTPFAIGFFLVSNPSNIFLAAVLGGFGAMLSDLVIFKFIRFSFMDEFKKLENEKPIKEISKLIEKNLSHKIKIYLLYAFAGIIIASPLPDEAGVIMLAGLTKIKTGVLLTISFIFNTLGILILLLI